MEDSEGAGWDAGAVVGAGVSVVLSVAKMARFQPSGVLLVNDAELAGEVGGGTGFVVGVPGDGIGEDFADIEVVVGGFGGAGDGGGEGGGEEEGGGEGEESHWVVLFVVVEFGGADFR